MRTISRNNLFSYLIILSLSDITSSYSHNAAGLTSFPTDIPATEIEISLYRNSLTTFPGDAFDSFTALEVLTLRENDIVVFPNIEAVKTTLTHLDLSINQ